jgi:hypothetical protein
VNVGMDDLLHRMNASFVARGSAHNHRDRLFRQQESDREDRGPTKLLEPVKAEGLPLAVEVFQFSAARNISAGAIREFLDNGAPTATRTPTLGGQS